MLQNVYLIFRCRLFIEVLLVSTFYSGFPIETSQTRFSENSLRFHLMAIPLFLLDPTLQICQTMHHLEYGISFCNFFFQLQVKSAISTLNILTLNYKYKKKKPGIPSANGTFNLSLSTLHFMSCANLFLVRGTPINQHSRRNLCIFNCSSLLNTGGHPSFGLVSVPLTLQ